MASEKLATPWLDKSVVHFKNILVATDTRLSDHPIVDKAAKIAETEDAMVKIVDVVPEFPWVVRLALQDHEFIQETMIREKKEQLAVKPHSFVSPITLPDTANVESPT